jgi:hypothetical protein
MHAFIFDFWYYLLPAAASPAKKPGNTKRKAEEEEEEVVVTPKETTTATGTLTSAKRQKIGMDPLLFSYCLASATVENEGREYSDESCIFPFLSLPLLNYHVCDCSDRDGTIGRASQERGQFGRGRGTCSPGAAYYCSYCFCGHGIRKLFRLSQSKIP